MARKSDNLPVHSGQRLTKISLENTAAKVFRLYPHRKKELFFLRNPQWVIYKLDFLSALNYIAVFTLCKLELDTGS